MVALSCAVIVFRVIPASYFLGKEVHRLSGTRKGMLHRGIILGRCLGVSSTAEFSSV